MTLIQTCHHEPQKLLTTCMALSGQNSYEIDDFKSELMQHATVSSSVVQLNDLRCLLPAPLVPQPGLDGSVPAARCPSPREDTHTQG